MDGLPHPSNFSIQTAGVATVITSIVVGLALISDRDHEPACHIWKERLENFPDVEKSLMEVQENLFNFLYVKID
jgi:hypothetical protein